ncbi:4-coumarate--CoA ligase-like 9 [Pistacia vera]|uniref:4-coumarate--CoA ligase-like 9 n=1 Tax=Pistacia vera TaxID=55513 RepID=UPI001263D9CF|nr:4-coumarate--CoA ligase-like 9 [Pistacia vera]
MEQRSLQIDPKSGFNSLTKTFHSVRPPVHLPPENAFLSAAEYAFSLRAKSPWPDDSVALINSITGQQISYSEFDSRTKSLAAYLQKVTQLFKHDVAFVLSPNSIQVPILYFSLLSLGVIISPANPVATEREVYGQIQLSKPVIAFATSSTVHKLPKLRHQTILIDSPEFESMMVSSKYEFEHVKLSQSDLAAIMYSSGTTGKVKGVKLTHKNFIAQTAINSAAWEMSEKRKSPSVMLFTTPYFHIFGFFYSIRSVALSEKAVVMDRFEWKNMLKAVQEFSVTHVALTPPVVVKLSKDGSADGYDLSSLETVICGAAPLGQEAIAAFTARFPKVMLAQGYGLTESTAAVARTIGPEENMKWGSTGKLYAGFEAKVVDPETSEALPPCREGELWIRGPTIMKGYVGEPEATSATLVCDGWMRTGDLCYIDENGFLFIVDRLKELIKYKGYQVAPAELEQVLISHPQVADAAVIPYPDKETGQVPMAIVVRQPQNTLSETEIMDFVAKQVAPYKKIRRVAFINSIPKSAAGKLLRKDLIRKFVLPPPASSRL